MQYVNVHEGASDKGNYNSRGSEGCVTINPKDAKSFFFNFDWRGTNGTTGTSSGTIIISRGNKSQGEKNLKIEANKKESEYIEYLKFNWHEY